MERIYNDLTIGYQDIIDCKTLRSLSGCHNATFNLIHDENVTSLMIAYSWKDEKTSEFHKADIAFYINGVDATNLEEAKDIYYDVYDSLYEAYSEGPDQVIFMDSLVTEVLRRHSIPRR